jgi:hypothetical protein
MFHAVLYKKFGLLAGIRRITRRIYARCTPSYWRDEAIAAPDDRLDAALARLLVIEDRAKRRDLSE